MDDQKPIGVGLCEHRHEVQRPPVVVELEALEIPLRARQGEDRTRPPSNPPRASELGDMAKPQPVVWSIEPVRTGQPQPLGFVLKLTHVHLGFPSYDTERRRPWGSVLSRLRSSLRRGGGARESLQGKMAWTDPVTLRHC